MNSKIKNYVEVLFKDVPNTKKAQELKEEILSTLNDHFEGHIAEGKSENQAYTESLADLGDIDALLKDLEPEQALKTKIDNYKAKRAKNTSIAVALYIIGTAFLIGLGGISEILNLGNEDLMGVIGLVCLLVFSAVATALIIYTNMSMPQDVEQYITQEKKRGRHNIDYSKSKSLRFLGAFMKIYWVLVTVIYLAVSFSTGKWGWTWLIWIIASAIKQALFILFDTSEDEMDKITDKN